MLAVAVLVFGASAFIPSGTFGQEPTPGNGMNGMNGRDPMHGWFSTDLPPAFEFLRDIPEDQRFEHFREARFVVADRDNNFRTIHMRPGTVDEVMVDSIRILPNGETQTRVYAITNETRVASEQDREVTIQDVRPGDQVVIATLDEQQAVGDPRAELITLVPAEHRTQPTPTPDPAPAPAPAP